MIALKGRAGPTERGDRLPVSLELFSTSKVSALLERDTRDDWRAAYHNVLADVWSHLSDYSSETLRYVQLLSVERCGEALFQEEEIRRIHFGDAQRIVHGRHPSRHACGLKVE